MYHIVRGKEHFRGSNTYLSQKLNNRRPGQTNLPKTVAAVIPFSISETECVMLAAWVHGVITDYARFAA